MRNNLKLKLMKTMPIIFTALSIAGVVGTAVAAVKATPKALKLLKAKKDELGRDDLTIQETVQTAWKCYIPTFFIGLGTSICITGIGIISKSTQATLASAYGLLNESYKEYRQAATKLYGEDADARIQAEMAKDANVYCAYSGLQIYNTDLNPNDEILLFYDLVTKRYFNSTLASVLNAQYHVNRNLSLRGSSSVNEYSSFLGLENVEHGDKFGWDIEQMIDDSDIYWIDFDNRKATMDDGMECIVIGATEPARLKPSYYI